MTWSNVSRTVDGVGWLLIWSFGAMSSEYKLRKQIRKHVMEGLTGD
jgi:C-terminal processing protease CtpA/Prc